jgi:hypothetical protein
MQRVGIMAAVLVGGLLTILLAIFNFRWAGLL